MGAMRSRAEPRSPLDPGHAAGRHHAGPQDGLGQSEQLLAGPVAPGHDVDVALGDGLERRCGRVQLRAQRGEQLDEAGGRWVEPFADELVEHGAQPGGHGQDVGDQRVVGDDPADRVGRSADPTAGELAARRGRDDLLDAVGLVEHHEVVGRQHDAAGCDVGAVEVGVHDDDVGLGGPPAGALGEAGLALRALGSTGALVGADGDGVPDGGAGLERQLGRDRRSRSRMPTRAPPSGRGRRWPCRGDPGGRRAARPRAGGTRSWSGP